MNNKGLIGVIFAVAIILLFVVSFIVIDISAYCTTYQITGTVYEKHIDNSGDNSHYIVVLANKDKLEVNRQPFDWNPDHNPDVIYAFLQVNATYTFTCWGWVNELFYWYPNVIEAV